MKNTLMLSQVLSFSRRDEHANKTICLVDGSTWKSYPKLAEFITQMTQDLVGYDIDVEFRTNFDGSAKGAAFIAASNKS